MISQDTKDQIDKVGKQHARAMYPGGDRLNHGRIAFAEGYSEGAYEYAEKLEEKDKEIEKLTEDSRLWEIAHDNCANHFDDLKKQLESKSHELAQLKEFQIWFYKKQFGFETNKSAQSNIDLDYVEWCKQNLK